jgi:hypothetical protein
MGTISKILLIFCVFSSISHADLNDKSSKLNKVLTMPEAIETGLRLVEKQGFGYYSLRAQSYAWALLKQDNEPMKFRDFVVAVCEGTLKYPWVAGYCLEQGIEMSYDRDASDLLNRDEQKGGCPEDTKYFFKQKERRNLCLIDFLKGK